MLSPSRNRILARQSWRRPELDRRDSLRLAKQDRQRKLSLVQLEDRWVPAPLQFFYVPMPEQATLAGLEAIGNGSQGNSMTSFVYISASENGTILHYDQWEDGYEANLGTPLQATTQVWGDNNPANGIPPGFATDVINAGKVIQLRNDLAANPRDSSKIFFDGGDLIGANKISAVTHGQFPVTSGSVITSAVEVRDTRFFDTSFRSPVGVNTANAGQMFEFSQFFVMASLDNTTVMIDRDNDGTFEQTAMINRGDNIVSANNVVQGGRVVADKPVQVNLLTGDIGSGFASRTYSLYSAPQLTNDYFTPVGLAGAADPVRLFIYNPNAAAITVNFETKSTSGAVGVVPANGSAFFDVPADTGTRLFTPGLQNFMAIGAYDQQDTAHDWGFSLQPVNSLSQIALVALGVGNSTNPPSGSPNTSPIWVTPLAATRVYADWDGNPATGALTDPMGNKYDQHFDLARLQSQRIYDTNDNDNSGMRIYTVSGVTISTAWGEDVTAPGGSPGFDAGSTVLALPVPEFIKFADFAPGGDLNGDGFFNSGDVVRYSIRVVNTGTLPISNAKILDTLPSQVTYVANSTTIDDGLGVSPVMDSGLTAFPLDESGYIIANINGLPSTMNTVLFTFDVTINGGLSAGTTTITNFSTMSYDIYTFPAVNTINLRSAIGDFVWDDQNGNGIQDLGEPGFSNVTVNLLNSANMVIATTTTNGSGFYAFTNLVAGKYTVEFVPPPGCLFSAPNKGGNANLDSDADPTTGRTVQITLGDGEINNSIDAAILSPSSITGFIYIDANNNGLFELGETPSKGIDVQLTGIDDLGNAVSVTKTTAADGSYLFDLLRPGTYKIAQITEPVGTLDGKSTPGTKFGGTGVVDAINNIVVTPNINAFNYNIADLLPSSLSGFVWEDANNDGIFDIGETAIKGASVQLTGKDDLGNTINITVMTDAAGKYDFKNLRPSDATGYTITETTPAAYLDGKDTLGTPGGSLANDVISKIVLSPGVNGANNNFAELVPASIAGFIYIDANNNGGVDIGEKGSSPIDVQLTGTDDLGNKVSLTQTTLADGSYSFVQLRPGNYSVTEITEPANTVDGKSTAGAPFGGSAATDTITGIVITPGGKGTNYNIADRAAAALSGFVFSDKNNDGKFDITETGIGGVTVKLSGTDDGGNPVNLMDVTKADGSYAFNGLVPGTYTLTEVQPAAFLDGKDTIGTAGGTLGNDTFSKITVATGVNGSNYDFGELAPASITGFIYLDANNDGKFDVSELPSGGIDVQLTGKDDLGNSVSITKTTLADGSYVFDMLRPGTYQIAQITEPVNSLDGLSTPGSPFGGTGVTDAISNIVVTAGGSGTNYNIADIPLAGLSGFVWEDANNDGIFDIGETPIQNASVQLSGFDDLGNLVLTTVSTDATGKYLFNNLRPSDVNGYVLIETTPAGYLDGKDSVGTPGGTLANDVISDIVLKAGVTGVNNNFAELKPASISGFIYIDANNNGIFDLGETPSGGIDVQLTGTDDLGNSIKTTKTTLADGSYLFDQLRPGTYRLAEITEPASTFDGKSTPGSPFGGKSATDAIDNIVVTPGGNGTNYNIADINPSSLSGFIWEDADNDGVFDIGETPIVNASVTLTGKDDLGNVVNVTVSTDGTGKFEFKNLRPSDANGYTITETTPVGYLDGKDTLGSQGGTLGNDVVSMIVLNPGVTGTNNNFAELKPASISGFIYIDANNNGLFELGETPSGGIDVQLTGTDDLGNKVSVTKTTLGDGSYLFDLLRPGTYAVTEITEPANSLDGKSTPGTKFGGTAATDAINNIVVTPGGNGTNYNIADISPSSLSGFIWEDANNDGIFDASETPIKGAVVQLSGFDDLGAPVTLTVMTDAAGKYQFTNVRPSDKTGYTITETTPAGYLDGKDTVGTPGGTLGNDVISKIVVAPGTSGTNNNFAELKPASIAGFIYIDANNNGIFELGETPSGGIDVQLTGTDDLGNKVLATKTTLADGSYLFDLLRPGTYAITEINEPANTLDGKSTPGAPFGGTAANDAISNIVVTVGGNGTNYNIADLTPSSLSGFIWEDADNDGIFDVGETPIQNASVQLSGFDDLGNVVLSTLKTDATGKYNFTNLRPSDSNGYVLIETTPAGYLDGNDSLGTQGGKLGNDVITDIVLNAGVNGVNNNFAELVPASISGFIYIDGNNNGIFDLGDSPSGSIDVQLTGKDDLGNLISVTKTTLADGSYQFDMLRPGTYKVSEITEPANTLDGKSTAGTPFGGTAATDNIDLIAVTPGGKGINYNIADLAPSSLSGFVWEDANNDGIFDVSETPIKGAVVQLSGQDDLGGSVTLSVMTDAAGKYQFTNVRPSDATGYTITETTPVGYLDGKDTVGTPGGTLGNDVISKIVVNPGVTGTNNNFAELKPASISGFIYIDANNNGLYELGESGSGMISIQLTGTDDLGNMVTLTTSTLNDGSYLFDQLRPGSYTVTEITEPAGTLDGKSAPGTPFGGKAATDAITAITVTAGGAGINYNIADLTPSTLSGFIWEDADNDGIFDVGETPIQGATVKLTGIDDNGTPVSITVMTDATGNYQFTNLRPSDATGYTITETTPVGYLDGKDTVGTPGGTLGNDVISQIVVAPGTTGTNNNFAELKPASISGFIYIDANNNGVYELGETPSGGIDVQLTGTDDLGNLVNLTMTTKADGSYLFDLLRPGTYQLAEVTEPANTLDGKSTPGAPFGGTAATDAISNIVVTVGGNGTNYNIADLTPSNLSGFIWEDADNDGIFDVGETPIQGATVKLTGVDDNGAPVSVAVVTDATGMYQFINIRPSDANGYTITETTPAGYLDGKDTLGTQGGTLGNDVISKIVVTPGTNGTNNNFAELKPASISGFVYLDANNNGIFELGESTSGGISVQLKGTDDLGPVSITTTTKADGSYLFDQLRPGTYTVTEITEPANTLDGKSTAGTPFGGTPVNDAINNIVVTVGGMGINYNIADVLPSSLSGFIWDDANNNGVFDAGEPPIVGASVKLFGIDDQGNAVSITVMTDGTGKYTFTSIRPSSANGYTIAETQPFGFLDGKDSLGTQGGTLGNDVISKIVVNPGTNGTNNNFAELKPASIAGFVYLDSNNNGLFELGETVSPGIAVQLTGKDDLGNAVSLTQNSKGDGSFLFDLLRPGTYTLTEVGQPAGAFDGKSTVGTIFGGTPTTNNISNIVVIPGGNGFNYNFADLAPSSLSGVVFFDPNENGVQDLGEKGIGGVVITLNGTDTNGMKVSKTTSTLVDGTYSFTGLLGGDYTITETQPTLYADGQDKAGNFGGTVGNDSTTLTLPIGGAGTGYTFAEVGRTIAGTVFLDRDRDCVIDPGEPGLGGLTVTLRDKMNNVVATTKTISGGSYAFTEQLLMDYTVDVQLASGYKAVQPLTTMVTLTNAGISGLNFCQTLATLSGVVYRDYNLDGKQGGVNETGIGGVTITLTGTDVNNMGVNKTTVTAADGSFTFIDILQGTYTLTETQPPAPFAPNGIYDGFNALGTAGGKLGAQGTNIISNINLGAGVDGTNYQYGEIPPADPFGFVWIDVNNNGIREAGEPGIPGVQVTISGTAFNGTALARPLVGSDLPGGSLTVVTDATGKYEFTPMPPGLFTITEKQPTGYVDGKEENADLAGPFTVIVTNDSFANIELSPNPVRGPFNFGEVASSSLAGSVFLDTNQNGVQDGTEPGVGGVLIRLTGTDILGNPVSRTYVTGASGSYSFTGLLPGTYSISETQPGGVIDGPDYLGTAGGVAGNDVFSSIIIGTGVAGRSYNFLELVPTQLPSKEQLLASTKALGAVVNGLVSTNLPMSPNYTNSPAVTKIAPTTPPRYVATGAGAGGGPHVRVFDFATGTEKFSFFAYAPSFTGGVRVATGDVNGDGTPDIITAPGAGGSPHIRIFNGINGALLNEFMAFTPSFTGGVYVAAGDVNNDGTSEVIVGAGEGGGPHVRIFNGNNSTIVAEQYVFIPSFTGGVRVAAGDLNADGKADVIVAAGPGGGPHVKAFSGGSSVLLHEFFAFAASFHGGVYVAAGDVNGDGNADIITSAGPGGGPHVRARSGSNLAELASFFAYPSNFLGGVTVGARDINGDGRADIICAPASGLPAHIRIVDAKNGDDLDAFLGYDASFRGGAWVA